MTEKRNYKYSIQVGVDCILTEEEKNLLAIKMGDVLTEVLGEEPKSGITNIYSE